eukprot:1152842-Pelagomonas_calceolata.AAC.7
MSVCAWRILTGKLVSGFAWNVLTGKVLSVLGALSIALQPPLLLHRQRRLCERVQSGYMCKDAQSFAASHSLTALATMSVQTYITVRRWASLYAVSLSLQTNAHGYSCSDWNEDELSLLQDGYLFA